MREPGIVIGGRRGSRLRKGAVPAAVAIVILIAALFVASWLFDRATAYDQPSGKRPALSLTARDREIWLGDHKLGRRGDLWTVWLYGAPYEMGYARGRLLARVGAPTEHELRINAAPPQGGLGGMFARMRRRWARRNLAHALPPALRKELAGFARGLGDAGADAPSYRDLVYQQALFDRGQQPVSVKHTDPARLARTALAFAGRGAGPTGHVFVGASVRLGAPGADALPPVVELAHPEGLIPYAALTWPGQIGVLVGVNQNGIAIVVVPARSRDARDGGEPVAVVARGVLEQASTLADAIAIVKKRPTLSSASLLIASGREGDAVVIERTPRRAAIRRATEAGVWASGHFISPEFESDGDNDRLRRYGVSGPRYQRLSEMVSERRGLLDAARALDVLRDRHAPGGIELPLGHPSALNAMDGARPIVIDTTGMTMWIGEGPSALGAMRAFDVRHELLGAEEQKTALAAPPADLPADPLLTSIAFDDYQVASAELGEAARLYRAGKWKLSLDSARRALAFAPRLPAVNKLCADLLRSLRLEDEAKQRYAEFLKLSPPYLDEIEEVRAYLGLF